MGEHKLSGLEKVALGFGYGGVVLACGAGLAYSANLFYKNGLNYFCTTEDGGYAGLTIGLSVVGLGFVGFAIKQVVKPRQDGIPD